MAISKGNGVLNILEQHNVEIILWLQMCSG